MEKINYQIKMEEIITQLQDQNPPPRLLLHSCCGPCSTYVLEYLSNYFEITVYYYNPNIYPPAEYAFREEEQEKLIARLETKHPIHFLRASYTPAEYYDRIHGLEQEAEGGLRCTQCYALRLEAAAKAAQEGHFDYFTTTLSISPHKDAQRLNSIGQNLGEAYGVPYLVSDFKKKNGFKRSTELTREYGMYRQDYCGCVFSYQEKQKRDAEEERKEEA